MVSVGTLLRMPLTVMNQLLYARRFQLILDDIGPSNIRTHNYMLNRIDVTMNWCTYGQRNTCVHVDTIDLTNT